MPLPQSEAPATSVAFSPEVILIFGAAAYGIFGWALPGAFTGYGRADNAAVQQLSQSNLVNQLIWLGLFFTGFAFAISRWRSGVKFSPTLPTVLLIFYLTLCLISVYWALSPEIAARRLIQQCIVVFLFVGVPALARNQLVMLNSLYLALAFAILTSACLFPFIPSTALGYSGLYPQKNLLGAVCAVGLIFSVFLALSPRARYKSFTICIAIVSLLLLISTRSKTSLGLAILCPCLSCVALLTSRFLRVSVGFAILAVTVIGLAFLWALAALADISAEQLSLLLFNDTTFTGRTEIWSFVWTYIAQHPWLGWGYQSFWSAGLDSPNLRATNFIAGLNQAHNGYLDILIETGIVGFAIVMSFIIALFVAIEQKWKGRLDVLLLLLSLTLFCVVHNFLESSLTRGFSPLWIVLLVIAGSSMSHEGGAGASTVKTENHARYGLEGRRSVMTKIKPS